jgi:cell division protein FtsB
VIKDNEERTRAYITELKSQIDAIEERIDSVAGTYVANYRMDDDFSWDILCSTCDDYVYSENTIVEIPNLGVKCHSCSMSDLEKENERIAKRNQIKREIKTLNTKLENLK